MIGYVILALAVAGLIAAVIFMFVKSDFPPYKHKKEGMYGSTKAIIWAENGHLLNQYNAHLIAKAAWCVAEAWRKQGLPHADKAKDLMKDVACLITTKEGFQRWGFYQWQVVASVQLWTKDKIYSKSIPMMVVHEGTVDRLSFSKTPEMQPMIHEMIHAVMDKVRRDADHDHEDDTIWAKQDDVQQLEEFAQELYKVW